MKYCLDGNPENVPAKRIRKGGDGPLQSGLVKLSGDNRRPEAACYAASGRGLCANAC